MATIRKLPSGRYNVQVRLDGTGNCPSAPRSRPSWKRGLGRPESKATSIPEITMAIRACALLRMQSTHSTRVPRRSRRQTTAPAISRGGARSSATRNSSTLPATSSTPAVSRSTAENIEEKADRKARHRSPQTVRHYLMSLSACMEYARRKKRWIEKNPVADIDASHASLFPFHAAPPPYRERSSGAPCRPSFFPCSLRFAGAPSVHLVNNSLSLTEFEPAEVRV